MHYDPKLLYFVSLAHGVSVVCSFRSFQQEMAFLRRVSGRTSVFPRRFCQSLGPVLHDNKYDTKSDSPDSSHMNRRFLSYGLHSQIHRLGSLLEERKHTSFARPVGSLFLARRHMSSIREEVELVAADSHFLSYTLQCLIGELAATGSNWWLSIALTGPLYALTASLGWNCATSITNALFNWILIKSEREIQAGDQRALAEFKKMEAEMNQIFEATLSSFWAGITFHAVIYIPSYCAIRNMAQKIPSFKSGGILWFTDLSTPDNLYILPLATGLTFWFATEVFQKQKNLVGRTWKLPCWMCATVAFQAIFKLESAMFCFMIPFQISVLAIQLWISSPKKMPKLRRLLGLPPVVAPQPGSSSHSAYENNTHVAESLSEQSKITQRVLRLRKQLSDKEKDKK